MSARAKSIDPAAAFELLGGALVGWMAGEEYEKARQTEAFKIGPPRFLTGPISTVQRPTPERAKYNKATELRDLVASWLFDHGFRPDVAAYDRVELEEAIARDPIFREDASGPMQCTLAAYRAHAHETKARIGNWPTRKHDEEWATNAGYARDSVVRKQRAAFVESLPPAEREAMKRHRT